MLNHRYQAGRRILASGLESIHDLLAVVERVDLSAKATPRIVGLARYPVRSY
jgi:hypothetical protein